MRPLPALVMGLIIVAAATAGERPALEKGRFRFTPIGDQKEAPERYRLSARESTYDLEWVHSLPGAAVDLYYLRFPSPVESPHRENNTVHAEYYRPAGPGPFPGVIVLDITAGNQNLSRGIATHLAQNGIAGLFVQMAYYGPRRPPGSRLRLLSPDLPQTMAAIRQTVLDLRMAAAWMEARSELDPKRLGILGTSLGSFLASLTAEMEPRLGRVAVLLGGGGLVDGFYDHPQAAPYRKVYEALGGTKEKIKKIIAPVDPLTCAGNLKDHKLLIIAGKRDEIVPPRMAEALWQASGKQKIVWFDCTHYGAALYLAAGLDHIVKHFGAQ
jgi:dienelactone hydrolase